MGVLPFPGTSTADILKIMPGGHLKGGVFMGEHPYN